jgi:hypothetical protein
MSFGPIGPWMLATAVSAVFFCATLFMRARILTTQDLYLHIAVGRWIRIHQLVPDRGIFSGSMPDAPWLAHEWLASLGAAALFDHLGWNGLAAATALLVAIAIGIVAHEAARTAGPVQALACAVLAWGLCLVHIAARPHMTTLPLFALWIAAHVRARTAHRAPPLYLALAMTLWANLHGGFLIGPAFTLLFALEATYAADCWRQAGFAALRWGIFLAAALLAALVTPHGLSGLLFPIHLSSMTSALANINEWQPSSLDNNAPLIIWLLLFFFVVAVFALRVAITRVVMILILIYLAFAHVRHTDLLAVAAPLLLLDALAETRFKNFAGETLFWGKPARSPVVAVVAFILVAMTVSSLVIIGRNPDHGTDRFTPEAAVNWAQAQHMQGQVLNSYNFGGYLIFRGIAPFIDGRVELYGQAFVTRDFALEQFPALLDEFRIGWTIFDPSNPRNLLLDRMPGWRRAYADPVAQIYVRQP